MTNLEALAAVAEQVMGWCPFETSGPQYPFLGYLPDGKILVHRTWGEVAQVWSPDTSPADALEMLEKWVILDGIGHEKRRSVVTRLSPFRVTECWSVELVHKDKSWYGRGDTFPAAAWAAVLRAEGIKVKE